MNEKRKSEIKVYSVFDHFRKMKNKNSKFFKKYDILIGKSKKFVAEADESKKEALRSEISDILNDDESYYKENPFSEMVRKHQPVEKQFVTINGNKTTVEFNVFTRRPNENYLDLSVKNLDSINEINGLENISSLKLLDLSENNISVIEGLDSLKDLRVLCLNNNDISKIQGFSELKNLEVLYLSNNTIRETSGLEEIRRLKELYLDNNYIKEFPNLENLNNLELLSISYNDIDVINFPKKVEILKHLNLSYNPIKDVRNVQGLLNFETIGLQGIESLEIRMKFLKFNSFFKEENQ